MPPSSDASAPLPVSGAEVRPPEVRPPEVRPPEVITELERIARRWAELPLAKAGAAVPIVRATLAALLELTASSAHPASAAHPDLSPGHDLPPDLGPAVIMDQLRVLTFDACQAAGAKPDPHLRGHGTAQVHRLLTQLRRALP